MRLLGFLIVLGMMAGPALADRHAIGATSFEVPPAWQLQADSADHATMVHTADQQLAIAVVSIPQPATANLETVFASEWKRVTTATPTATTPKPSKRKLGNRVVYEGMMTAKNEGGDVFAQLIMLDAGGQVVSTLIYTQDHKSQKALAPQVDQVVASVEVALTPAPAVAAASTPGVLTTIGLKDLVGTWRTGAGNSTDYANSSGSYTGSVTAVSGETFTIKADGSYTHAFSGMINGRVSKSTSEGTIALTGGVIVFTEGGKVYRKYKFIDYSTAADGSVQWRVINAQFEPTKINIDLYKEIYVRAPAKK